VTARLRVHASAVWDSAFVRFLLVGALNTAFGYALFAALVLFRLHYALAALVGQILGVLFNFGTTGSIVFGNRDPRLLVRFVAVYAVHYAAGVALLRLGLATGVPVLVTSAATTLPLAAFSFALQRLWVFPRHRPAPRPVAGS
jgi:putative flippase GtrA